MLMVMNDIYLMLLNPHKTPRTHDSVAIAIGSMHIIVSFAAVAQPHRLHDWPDRVNKEGLSLAASCVIM